MADTSTTYNDLPDYMREPVQQILETGEALAGQPYQQYEGPRIADFNEDQLLAFEQMGGIGELGGEYSEFAADYYFGGGLPVTAMNLEGYMNPYIQEALDPAAQDMERQWMGYMNDLGGQAGINNAFGGSRQALLETEGTRNYLEARGDLYSTGLANAYVQAVEAYGIDQDRKLQTGELLADLGVQEQAMGLIGVDQLLQSGGMQQDLEQRRYSLGYQDFINQRDWPYKQLDFYSSLVKGSPGASSSIVTREEESPNQFSQWAGLGIGALSLLSSLNSD